MIKYKKKGGGGGKSKKNRINISFKTMIKCYCKI